MTRADRIRRLTHDLAVYEGEFELLNQDPTLGRLCYLAERVVEEELSRARITGQTPAWALEPRT